MKTTHKQIVRPRTNLTWRLLQRLNLLKNRWSEGKNESHDQRKSTKFFSFMASTSTFPSLPTNGHQLDRSRIVVLIEFNHRLSEIKSHRRLRAVKVAINFHHQLGHWELGFSPHEIPRIRQQWNSFLGRFYHQETDGSIEILLITILLNYSQLNFTYTWGCMAI